ncbi:hypothetical protein GBP346_B1051 [Burkholderia pseudomallei MSHR346]|nr:hypothetical protein GBP346_B1051 [Burkholderia pseudomallei MSHR346]
MEVGRVCASGSAAAARMMLRRASSERRTANAADRPRRRPSHRTFRIRPRRRGEREATDRSRQVQYSAPAMVSRQATHVDG